MDTLLEPQLDPANDDIKPRILFIDDDQDQVDVLEYHLNGQGFEVFTANSASHGFQQVQESDPQLILLDIDLPDGSGLEVCSRVCDDPHTCQIPVIFVSGAEQPDVLRQARAAGCAYYMRKPYDPSALLVIIKQTLEDSVY